MRFHYLRASASICAILLMSGVAASADKRSASTETEVRSLLDTQVAAWNQGDLEGFMAGYWRSPELVFQSGGTKTLGWQPTLERYRKRYKSQGKEMGQLKFEGLEVVPLSVAAALVRGGWHLRM